MKNYFRFSILILLALFLIGCDKGSSDNQIKGIVVDSNTFKSSYNLDDFDIESINLIIKYEVEESKTVSITSSMISQQDLALLSEPGTHNITVNYEGFSITLTITLVDEETMLLHIYNIGVDAGVIADISFSEWLETIKGEQGLPGQDGREVTFRVNAGYIQWKYEDELNWTNLIPLTSLTGEQGIDARQVELRVNTNNLLQWKYVDSNIWTSIYDLNMIEGQEGVPGLTPYIGENGNWFIGDVDTNVPATGVVENMDRVGTDGLYFDLTIRNGIAGYEVVSYSGVDTDIVIPNEVFGQKVVSIKQGALPTTITSLSISKYTETLPSYQSYINLVSFDFNNAPVSSIPNNAFRDANKLELILNYDNLENIGTYAFYNTKILFNDFDFSNIVNIGDYAFYATSVPNLLIEGVIAYQEGTNYTISDQTFIYLPETVQSIGYRAFPDEFSVYYAGNSEVVFASAFFFKNVKQTEDGYWYVDRNTYVGLLNYTGELTELDVPNQLDGKNVTVVEQFAFVGDNHLTRINLPNSITSIGNYSFMLTRKLYIVHIPSSIVNISNSYFALWTELGFGSDGYGRNFPAPVLVFENNQVDMNFGTNTVEYYEWGRYAFGYSASQIKQDENFVYLEKTLTAEILAIKDASGVVTIPSSYNSKPVTRINQYSLIGYNGGVVMVDISDGIEFISTYAFYGSPTLRYVNIPSSVSAVNYHGFYALSSLTIYAEATEKPSNWDSTWYYNIKSVIWNSQLNGEVSSDELYLFSTSGSNATILAYLGNWSLTEPLIIPSNIEGYTVTSIATGAFVYTSANTPLEVVIPNTVTTINSRAFTYYRYLIVYSNLTQAPTGWVTDFGYNTYYGSTSSSYRTYYWQGTWTLVEGDPTAI